MSKIVPILSKIWLKVKNIENSLFLDLQEILDQLCNKECIKILDFAEIAEYVCITSKINSPKDRKKLQGHL